jgi:uncharacterized YccA/Bax inhibitor family protein
MADPTTAHTDVDVKTRANLAYMWSIAVIAMVAYTLWEYGHILAVLTLLIGFITGTAATILAVYFGAPIGQKKPDTSVNTADNATVNVATEAKK